MTTIVLDPSLTTNLTALLGSQIAKIESESPLDSEAVVAKITLNNGQSFRLNSRANQSKESCYLLPRYLAEHQFATEHLAILDPVGYLDHDRALVYEHIEGQTLRHLLPTIAAEVWFTRIGQLFRRLHDMSPPNFLDTISAVDLVRSFQLTSQAGIKAKEIAAQLHSAPVDRICHGDPNPSNLLVDENADQLTLIDFSAAGLGDAMMDIAILLVHSKLAGASEGYETAFWRGYGQIDSEASSRLKLWKGLICAHNALYIETWLSPDDPTRPSLIKERLAQAEKEIN